MKRAASLGHAPVQHWSADGLFRVSALREIEAQALAHTGPGELMARAGDAVAQVCAARLRTLPPRTPVLALIGTGNNGGDALLAAYRLAEWGWSVRAIALTPDASWPVDAARVMTQWRTARRSLEPLDALGEALAGRPLIIDGLFGVGTSRPLDAQAAALVRAVQAAALPVIAVDVPSGLNADTGAILGGASGAAIQAEITVSLLVDKPGLHTGMGREHAGRVVHADLGLHALAIAPPRAHRTGDLAARMGRLIGEREALSSLRPRPPGAHKGLFGNLVVVKGDPAMQGAARLALLGAQAMGVGRLYLAAAEPGLESIDPPEAMHRRIDPAAGDGLGMYGEADALVIGCGLGQSPAARLRLACALDHPAALLIDADGLNLIAQDPLHREALRQRSEQTRATVLTPHPLEAARLLGSSVQAVQEDRIDATCCLARQTGAVVVLKGAGTVVASPQGAWSLHPQGGPLLAVAGTGDVLAGTLGSALAQGLAPLDAARLAVWLHGTAADALAAQPEWSAGIGLPASRLPEAIRICLNQRFGRLQSEASGHSGPPDSYRA